SVPLSRCLRSGELLHRTSQARWILHFLRGLAVAFVRHGGHFAGTGSRVSLVAALRRRRSAACSTASTIFTKPVQRQRLPEIASLISSRVGEGFSARKATEVITKPGVQYPHCEPPQVWKASCT